jgi:hypothetical protein
MAVVLANACECVGVLGVTRCSYCLLFFYQTWGKMFFCMPSNTRQEDFSGYSNLWELCQIKLVAVAAGTIGGGDSDECGC